MSALRTWDGPWKTLIRGRINDLGFSSAAEFLAARPRTHYIALAAELGEEIVPAQLRRFAHEEAQAAGDFAGYMKSHLVRELCLALPEGWRGTSEDEFERAHAFGRWATPLTAAGEQDAETAWSRLVAAEIPAGWLPQDSTDPIITMACEGLNFE